MTIASSDVASSSVLVASVGWVKSVLLGSIGTAVAVLGVAAIGLLMLNGRVVARRGASIILGCFILFSAGTIAVALTSVSPTSEGWAPVQADTLEPTYRPTFQQPTAYDPYAGASVPNRQVEKPIMR